MGSYMRRVYSAYKIALAALITFAVQGIPSAAATTYYVAINTSPRINHPAGPFSLGLTMTDGSGLSDGNNTVTIGNVSFSGGGALGNPSQFGGVTGDLTSSVIMADSGTLHFFS